VVAAADAVGDNSTTGSGGRSSSAIITIPLDDAINPRRSHTATWRYGERRTRRRRRRMMMMMMMMMMI